jgi:hypothetical protein
LKKISLKAIVVVALAFAMFGATAAFADGIDVSALGGTYTFSGAVGSTFSTTTLGSLGISAHETSPVVGAPVSFVGSTIQFTSGLYLGGGNFAGGGTLSYSNAACGGSCFSGVTTGSTLLGSTALVNFTLQWVNPAFAALLGANFPNLQPYNSTGTLSFVLDPANNSISSADFGMTSQTPEPASLLMLGGGLLAIGGSIRRKLNLL